MDRPALIGGSASDEETGTTEAQRPKFSLKTVVITMFLGCAVGIISTSLVTRHGRQEDTNDNRFSMYTTDVNDIAEKTSLSDSHEGMHSKHDSCRVDTFSGSKKALPDGTYANYWCTGSIRCTRGLNAEEKKCGDGETYGNDGCVEKNDDEKMCAKCVKPGCKRVKTRR